MVIYVQRRPHSPLLLLCDDTYYYDPRLIQHLSAPHQKKNNSVYLSMYRRHNTPQALSVNFPKNRPDTLMKYQICLPLPGRSDRHLLLRRYSGLYREKSLPDLRYRPFLLRKSGIPLSVDTPAPPRKTVISDSSSISQKASVFRSPDKEWKYLAFYLWLEKPFIFTHSFLSVISGDPLLV